MDKAELYAILKGYFHFLGGWLVATTVLGNLLTWFIQHRFSVAMQDRQTKAQESLEAYKNELAGKLEEQKVSLDAIKAQNKTKFDYAHSQQVTTLKEIYRLCLAVQADATGLIVGCVFKNDTNPNTKILKESFDGHYMSLATDLAKLWTYREVNDVYLNEELIRVINDFTAYCNNVLEQAPMLEGGTAYVPFKAMDDKRKALDKAVREAVGTDII